MSNPEIIVSIAKVVGAHRIQTCHRYEEGQTDYLTCEDVYIGTWQPKLQITSLVLVGDVPEILGHSDLLENIINAEFRYTSAKFLDESLLLLKNLQSLSLVAAELPQTTVPSLTLWRVTLDNCLDASETTLSPRALEIRQPYMSQLPESIFAFCSSFSLYGLFLNTDKGVFQCAFLNSSHLRCLKKQSQFSQFWLEKIYLEYEDLQLILETGTAFLAIYDCEFFRYSKVSGNDFGIYSEVTELHLICSHFDNYAWLLRSCPNLQNFTLRSAYIEESYFKVLSKMPSLSEVDLTGSTLSRNISTPLYQVEFVSLTQKRGTSKRRAKILFPNADIEWNKGGC
jgi:hypothetical protein